jgi:hypothetical protein
VSWNPNIPQATDVVAQSQPQLLGNFGALDTWASVNHVGIGAASFSGEHTVVQMVLQGADPALNAGEVAIYNKTLTLTGVNELFVSKQATGTVIPMTAAVLGGVDGWSYLPSGLLMKWGTRNINGTANVTYPAGAGYPAFTSVFVMFTTPYNSGTNTVAINTIPGSATLAFNVTTTGGATTFSFLVLGK